MAELASVSNSSSNASVTRNKRRKSGTEQSDQAAAESCGGSRRRTETEQQIYSAKLVDALRHLRRADSSAVTARDVRHAADRVLAVSSKGKTRWSRAILTGRLSFQLAQINRKHRKAAKPVAGVRKTAVAKKLPPLQRKVKVLSRLVPGCRKLSLPNLLEETTDYIAALEMQVKAMTVLTSLLSGAVAAEPSHRLNEDTVF